MTEASTERIGQYYVDLYNDPTLALEETAIQTAEQEIEDSDKVNLRNIDFSVLDEFQEVMSEDILYFILTKIDLNIVDEAADPVQAAKNYFYYLALASVVELHIKDKVEESVIEDSSNSIFKNDLSKAALKRVKEYSDDVEAEKALQKSDSFSKPKVNKQQIFISLMNIINIYNNKIKNMLEEK